MAEAESFLHDAIGLLSTQPASAERDAIELGVQTKLGGLLIGKSFGAPEREEPLMRAYELGQRVTDVQAELLALFQLVQFYIQRMRLGEACGLAVRALEKASQTSGSLLNATAQYNAAESSFWSGDLKKSNEHANRARELFDQMPADAIVRDYAFDWRMAPIWLLALIELIFGKPELGISWENRLWPQALASPHPYSRALGIIFGTLSCAVRGAWQQVSEWVSSIYATCEEFGFHEIAASAKLLGGRAKLWRGEKSLGLAEMTEGIEELNSLGSFLFSSVWGLVLLAEGQIETQDYEAARISVGQGLKNLDWTRALWCEPEVYRVAGELERQRPGGDRGVSENQYRKAIEIAQQRSFKWWELRATTGLARLLRDTNRRDEARAMLAEIYNWFTEGFDTADLKDAKALLDELNQ